MTEEEYIYFRTPKLEEQLFAERRERNRMLTSPKRRFGYYFVCLNRKKLTPSIECGRFNNIYLLPSFSCSWDRTMHYNFVWVNHKIQFQFDFFRFRVRLQLETWKE